MHAEVLKEKDIEPVRDELEKIVPLKAAFDHNYAKRLDGENIMRDMTRWEMVEQLRKDIRDFKAAEGLDRVVVLGLHRPKYTFPSTKNATTPLPLSKRQ